MTSDTHRLPRLLAALLVTGCAAPPPPQPLAAPPLTLGVRHFAGTVLTGNRGGSTRIDLGAAFRVECRIHYVRTLGDSELTPLASHTRLVVAARSDDPLLPVAALAGGAQLGTGTAARHVAARVASGDATSTVALEPLHGWLPAGATVACFVDGQVRYPGAPAGKARQRVVVLVSRDRGEALSLALEIEDTTPWEPKAAETPAFERRRQIVVVDQAPQVDGAPLVLAFPSPFGEGSGRGFVATLSVQRQKSRPSEADLARCRAEITGTAAAAKRGAAPVDGVAAAALTLRTTLANLDLAHHHRASLVFLAGTVEAPLALDLSLIADDPTLAAWIATTGAAGTKDAGQAELGWKLEKSAFAILAKGLDGDGLPPQLMALMAHHAGEAGLLPGAMSTLLPRCNDRAALQRAIVQENLDALDSTDPSSRVRAFDWLKLRGQAPKGYDPLAPKADRRKALAPREEVQGR